jgi:hypothetical protein
VTKKVIRKISETEGDDALRKVIDKLRRSQKVSSNVSLKKAIKKTKSLDASGLALTEEKISHDDVVSAIAKLTARVGDRFLLAAKSSQFRKSELLTVLSKIQSKKMHSKICKDFRHLQFRTIDEKTTWMQNYLDTELGQVIPWYKFEWNPNYSESKMLWCFHCGRQKLFSGKQKDDSDYDLCEFCLTHSLRPERPN